MTTITADTPEIIVTREADRLEAETRMLSSRSAFFIAQAERETLSAKSLKLDIENTEIELSKTKKRRAEDLAANDENRVLDFTSEVSASSCESAMSILSKWVRLDKQKPITIRFSSPGGSVIAGLALYDYIVGRVRGFAGIYVTTVTIGWAASMACILLQAGDKRVMGENSHILIHEVSAMSVGKLTEMEDQTKFSRRLNTKLMGLLATRSKDSGCAKPMTKAAIETRAKRKDWWLDSTEAKRHGFCDAIGYGE